MEPEYIQALIADLIDMTHTDAEAMAIFGQNLGMEEDSSVDCLFSKYYRIEESLQFLMVQLIFDKVGYLVHPEDTEVTDIILDRFWDDDIRSGETDAHMLYDEFLDIAREYKNKED